MNNSVLVTGADGFIGSKVAKKLSSQYTVKAGVRRLSSVNKLENKFKVGDITGSTQWLDALMEVNTIVHLAAVVHNNSKDSDYINEVNVKGVVNLAKQAARCGVKRFIFISSISVFGNKSNTPFNESSIMSPQSYQAECKSKSEMSLLQISAKSGLEIVIIRPALVYGPSAPGNIAKLTNLIQKIPFLPFALCRNRRSFISVDNLVDFIATCIRDPKAANEIFCISDGHDVSIKEFTDGIAKGLNKKRVQFPVPVWLFKLFGKILGKSDLIDQLVGDLQVDSSKARTLLNWTPPVTMAETFSKLTTTKEELL